MIIFLVVVVRFYILAHLYYIFFSSVSLIEFISLIRTIRLNTSHRLQSILHTTQGFFRATSAIHIYIYIYWEILRVVFFPWASGRGSETWVVYEDM